MAGSYNQLKTDAVLPTPVAKGRPEDNALGAVLAADPTEARTTQDPYDKKGGWKPIDVDGTPGEYQIRPAKDIPEDCSVVTVRQKDAPKKILGSQYTCG